MRALSACMRAALMLLAFGLLPGCVTQDRMTADAIGCPVRDVEIVPSAYSSRGTETAWCATCKGKRYQCATNAQRTRTVCQASRDGDGCY
jgi:hypothetical protein